MGRIIIFNPDTDYALAAGRTNYTPPKSLRILIDSLNDTVSRLAEDNDIIIPYLSLPKNDLFHILELDKVPIKNLCIIPWGWNHSLRKKLISSGFPADILPSEEFIDRLRECSHRRTCIRANKFINTYLSATGVDPKHISPIPQELISVDELESFCHENNDIWLKAPWSSSGRGVYHYLKEKCSFDNCLKWGHGVIRRQGSVMVEKNADKMMDFATEWSIDNGEAEFIGYSYFKVEGSGNYQTNHILAQPEILNKITGIAPDFDHRWIDAQKGMLEEVIAPYYSGPAGIDMLATVNGSIRACIEINLRMTMGIVALRQQQK